MSGWLNWCTQFSYMKLEHPDHADWCLNGWTLYAQLALWRRASRWEHTSFGRLQLSSHICVLERNLSTCRTLKSVRQCCWDVWTVLVFQMNDAWIVERPNGISRCPNRCKGSDFSNLESGQNLLETKLWNEDSKNNWTPDKKHHYMKVILSNRMQPITNQQTPPLSILGQKHLTG